MGQQIENIFSFLRYSMEITDEIPQDLQEMDWRMLYDFSLKHCIVGVIYHGIARLPEGAPHPEAELEFQFYSLSDQIRRDNIRLNMVASKCTEMLQRDHFHNCILKGQGNALMYPDPYMRTCGDIDVWVDGFDKEVIEYVRKTFPQEKAFYHHIHYPIINGIKIELHYRPSYLESFYHNNNLQRFFSENKDEQFSHKVELPDDSGSVNIPTVPFNLTYQMVHVIRHFLSSGVGLRHLIDYYYLIKQGFSEDERKKTEKILYSIGMKNFVAGIMYILQVFFHLDNNDLIMPPNKRMGKFILSEILTTGNMGVSETRYSQFQSKGLWGKVSRGRKYIHFIPYLPALCINRPFFLFLEKKRWEEKFNRMES